MVWIVASSFNFSDEVDGFINIEIVFCSLIGWYSIQCP